MTARARAFLLSLRQRFEHAVARWLPDHSPDERADIAAHLVAAMISAAVALCFGGFTT